MSILKRIKLLYQLYNLFNYNKLRYQENLYKQYGLKKFLILSLASKDLPSYNQLNGPWLDHSDSEVELPKMQNYQKLDSAIQASLRPWSKNGYVVLKNFFSSQEVEQVNSLLTELVNSKKLLIKNNRKIMFSVRSSHEIRTIVNPPLLMEILEMLLGRPIEIFQSVNFLKGSEDPAHSDFFHMSTYPYGYMIAVWIALEDIDMENGPIFYYPGSHRLPYIMNNDIEVAKNCWLLGKDTSEKYHQKIQTIIDDQKYKKSYFTASKGDILIWHANMLHGGEKIMDLVRTRKSMVLHFYAKDVIRYHEITQRPAFKVNIT